jgi:ubiquinone/menaquinone biosynthesis C-methylase UbiE
LDQAVDYYDRSRPLPAAGWDDVVEALTSQLSQAALCVDIGIGTGRTALPLARAGIHLVGVDLSIPMLRRLIAKSGGVPLVPIVAGDATALPFRAGSFDAGLIIHVLHSVPRWQGVIVEAVRIGRRPGGRIIVDPGVSSNVVSQAIEARFVEELGQEPHRRAWTVETLDETFAGLGCRLIQLAEIQIVYQRPARRS